MRGRCQPGGRTCREARCGRIAGRKTRNDEYLPMPLVLAVHLYLLPYALCLYLLYSKRKMPNTAEPIATTVISPQLLGCLLLFAYPCEAYSSNSKNANNIFLVISFMYFPQSVKPKALYLHTGSQSLCRRPLP